MIVFVVALLESKDVLPNSDTEEPDKELTERVSDGLRTRKNGVRLGRVKEEEHLEDIRAGFLFVAIFHIAIQVPEEPFLHAWLLRGGDDHGDFLRRVGVRTEGMVDPWLNGKGPIGFGLEDIFAFDGEDDGARFDEKVFALAIMPMIRRVGWVLRRG
jgi:hypothetical protein